LANKWAHTPGIDNEAYFAAVREVLKLCGVKTLSREQRKNTTDWVNENLGSLKKDYDGGLRK